MSNFPSEPTLPRSAALSHQCLRRPHRELSVNLDRMELITAVFILGTGDQPMGTCPSLRPAAWGAQPPPEQHGSQHRDLALLQLSPY